MVSLQASKGGMRKAGTDFAFVWKEGKTRKGIKGQVQRHGRLLAQMEHMEVDINECYWQRGGA